MPTINKELLVPYSASAMYNLVNDIEKYPEFLPWCKSATIITKSAEEVTAELSLSYAAFSQSFTTRNTLVVDSKIIMQLVRGPLKHLQGEWQFIDINQHGSKVLFNLSFEVENSFLGLAIGKVFSGIASELVDHFYKRAKHVYG
jgi:ribosome-associated toxin RatA of RatAB toxin-antitoxin module